MAGVSFIEHKGVKILYENCSNTKPEEILPLMEEAKKIIFSQPLNSILALVNVKDTRFDASVISAAKDFVKGNKPYMKLVAVYGVEGLKEIIFRSVLAFSGRKNIVLCKTIEEGKDYLVSHADNDTR
ncbi:MAG: hypothetical protein JW976_06435 [Syntrophaceae bacterium]|nr:hypothetical protein [Syntrophaceae bacterium]